jgi:hypothetical protein
MSGEIAAAKHAKARWKLGFIISYSVVLKKIRAGRFGAAGMWKNRTHISEGAERDSTVASWIDYFTS